MIMNKKIYKSPSQMILIVFLFTLSFMMLLPFTWIISTSLRLPVDSFRLPPSFLPTSFHYQNYITVFTTFPFAQVVWNSVRIALIVVFANIVFSTMAGYAFSRIPFKGRDVIFLLILAGMMIPAQARLVPTFIVMSNLGLVGTHWPLILPVSVSPLNIFFVRQFMKTIPNSYEEAAFMDGASRLKIWLRIFVPMSKNVIVMVSLLSFLASWNDFINPLIFISREHMMTLPLGLRALNGANQQGSASVVLAGVALSLVIPVLFYVFGQKHIVKGVAMSGLKS